MKQEATNLASRTKPGLPRNFQETSASSLLRVDTTCCVQIYVLRVRRKLAAFIFSFVKRDQFQPGVLCGERGRRSSNEAARRGCILIIPRPHIHPHIIHTTQSRAGDIILPLTSGTLHAPPPKTQHDVGWSRARGRAGMDDPSLS